MIDQKQESDYDQERYRCLIRHIITKTREDSGYANDFLADHEKRHSKKSAEKMRKDMREQWKKGNKGETGDWRE